MLQTAAVTPPSHAWQLSEAGMNRSSVLTVGNLQMGRTVLVSRATSGL